MEQQQQLQGGGEDQSGWKSCICLHSSRRLAPTLDQIIILKDLYDNDGVRTPTAEQIQQICAKLRQYGNVEDKNVYYWFQNHRFRNPQKKRFAADIPMHHHRPPPSASAAKNATKFSNINPGSFASSSASSAASLVNVGSYGYGPVTMKRSCQECSITPTVRVGGQNFAWIGVDPYSSPYPFLEKRRYTNTSGDLTLDTAEEEEDENKGAGPEIKTLPLFPMHGDLKPETDYFNGWHHGADDTIAARSKVSLELSLNSYAAGFNH